MNRYPKDEEGLMHHYFPHDSYVAGILDTMRKGFNGIQTKRITETHVQAAKLETELKARTLDISTYPFAYDLSRYDHRKESDYRGKIRVVMLADGMLKGFRGNMQTVIPIDLGENPYELFQEQRRTIDHAVTIEQVEKYLAANRDALREEGFSSFHVDRSLFFYLRRGYIKRFLQSHDQIDLTGLTRLVYPTKGYVGLEKVEMPTFEEYMEQAPLFRSSRLKKSLARKLRRKLWEENPREVKDWAAHRVVVESRLDVENLASKLMSSPKIGNSHVRYLRHDDYYSNPKPSGFEGMNIVVEVETGNEMPCVREIQIIDKKQYYHNEFEEDRTSHSKHKLRMEHRPKRVKVLYDSYGSTLENILGVGILDINVP